MYVLKPDSPTVLAGRFQLLRELGSGGYGLVYEAIDIEWGSRVALKTLQRMEPDALLRFKEEFRALQDVEHPNLVHLEELTCSDGLWFFTMELVEGTDFLNYVRPRVAELSYLQVRALDERRLRGVLPQLLAALAAIHASGRVHCDVKPSNIRVDAAGRLVLLDFGLVTGGKLMLTSDCVLGTPSYMAPEQCRGDPVSAATDLYSVGVLLYEALTGDVPYSGDAVRVLLEKQHRLPPPPSSLAPEIPEQLAELCMRMLALAPAQRPSGSEIGALLSQTSFTQPPATGGAATPLPERPPFVGRGAQLAWLRQRFAQTCGGRPCFAYVAGDSGVGKTALATHFAEQLRATEQALVLHGRCFERETVPYKAFDGIVDDLALYLAECDAEQVRALLPFDAKLLVQIFPVLSRIKPVGELSPARAFQDPNVLRSQTFAALREVLARLSMERPLLLVIDDLHWSDLDSLALLEDLLGGPDAPGCMVLATGRPLGELSSELSPTLGQILETGPSAQLLLSGLEEGDAAQLGCALSGNKGHDSHVFRRIAQEAKGHPLFVAELVRHLDAGHALGETRVLDDALRTRAQALDDGTRALLETLAVAGMPCEHGVLMHALGLTSTALARRLAQLRVQHLARSEGKQRAECYHDRVRRALLDGLSDAVKRQRHRALAQALSSLGDSHGERVAYQWRCAGEDAKAARYCAQAAEQAFRALAFKRSARLYAEALTEPEEFSATEQFELRVAHARALSCAGFASRAAEVCLEAANTRSGEDARGLRRQATLLMLRSGHVQEGLELADSVLREIGLSRPATPVRAIARLMWERARLSRRRLDGRSARPDPARAETLELLWAVAPSLAFVDFLGGSALQSLYTRLALQGGDIQHVVRSLAVEAMLRGTMDPPPQDQVSRILTRVRQLADGRDAPYLRALVQMSHGYVHWMNFRLAEATAQLVQAERLLRESCVDASWELTNARIGLLNALWNAGRLWKHDELARDWLRDARDRGDRYARTQLMYLGLGYQLSLRHNVAEAAEHALTEGLKGWPDEFQLPHWGQYIGRLLVELYKGEGGAYELWQSCWPRLRRSQLLRAPYLAFLSYADGAWVCLDEAVRAPRSGRPELLRQALHCARKVAETRRPLAHAVSEQIRAQSLLVVGRTDEAVALLTRAEAVLRTHQSIYQFPTAHLLGTLIGGEQGKLHCTQALTWATSQGISDPRRWFSMFVPVLRAHSDVKSVYSS